MSTAPQADPVASFQALPRERQSDLLQKMSPDQKTKLMAGIKAKQATHTPGGAGGTWTPESTGQKVAGNVAAALPAAGAMAGEYIGAKTGPAGAVRGATLGAGAGSVLKQGIDYVAGVDEAPKTLHEAAKNIEGDMAIQGGLTLVAGAAGSAFSKLGAKASGKVLESVNRYLGLMKSDLPVWERLNVKGTNEVAQTVIEKVGMRKTLPELHQAIESTRQSVNTQTERIVTNAGPTARLTPAHAMIDTIGQNLGDELALAGRTPEAFKAVNLNVDSLKRALPPNATPSELFTLRKAIGSEINWKVEDPTDVRQKFLKALYPKLNEAIKNALPAADSRAFSELNRTQNRLIIARDAAGEKMMKESLGRYPGIATIGKRAFTGAAIGGVVGGLGGELSGHGEAGGITGAAAGATLGAVGFHGRELSRQATAESADVAVNKAVAKVAPVLAKAAKTSPQAARAAAIVMKAIRGDKKPVAQSAP